MVSLLAIFHALSLLHFPLPHFQRPHPDRTTWTASVHHPVSNTDTDVRNGVTNQAAYTYPLATVGDTVFYRISRWRTRTGSTCNFAIAKYWNIVPTPKWGYTARRTYATSTDSGRHHVCWIYKKGRGNSRKRWSLRYLSEYCRHSQSRTGLYIKPYTYA